MGGNATHTNNFLAMVTDKYLHKQSGSCQPWKTLNHESCGRCVGLMGGNANKRTISWQCQPWETVNKPTITPSWSPNLLIIHYPNRPNWGE